VLNENAIDDNKLVGWIRLEGYKYIGINEAVCGGDPTIVGTRIKPENIYNYGSVKDIMEDFGLSEDEVLEAMKFLESK